MNASEAEFSLPCEGKIVFDTKKQAEATALTVSWQHGTKLKPYKCNHCQLWHLSTNNKD